MKHLAKDKGGKVVEDAEEKCEELMFTYNQHLRNKYDRYCYRYYYYLRNKYDRYYYCFVCCEALNLLIVLCQLLLTNSFLGDQNKILFAGMQIFFPGGYFMTYGADVYNFYSLPPEELLLEDARNPMCEAFPRVGTSIQCHLQCIFHPHFFNAPGCELHLLSVRRGGQTVRSQRPLYSRPEHHHRQGVPRHLVLVHPPHPLRGRQDHRQVAATELS